MFVLLILGSMGFPPSVNFLGELIVLNSIIIAIGGTMILYSMIALSVGVYYHLFVVSRVLFGHNSYITKFSEITKFETITCLLWIIPLFTCGIVPFVWINKPI